MPAKPPLSTAELAAKFGVSKQRVAQWVDDGRLSPLYGADRRPWQFARTTRKPRVGQAGRPKQGGE